MLQVKISDKPINGGYSFSANSDVLTLSSTAKDLSEPEYNLLVQEGTLVRELYIQGVEEAKAKGEKVSPSTIKAKAIAVAKARLQPEKKYDVNLEVTEVKDTRPSEKVEQVYNQESFDGLFDDDPLCQVYREDPSVSAFSESAKEEDVAEEEVNPFDEVKADEAGSLDSDLEYESPFDDDIKL